MTIKACLTSERQNWKTPKRFKEAEEEIKQLKIAMDDYAIMIGDKFVSPKIFYQKNKKIQSLEQRLANSWEKRTVEELESYLWKRGVHLHTDAEATALVQFLDKKKED